MRFKIDENLPEEFVELFRRAGWNAESVVDENLGGSSDSDLTLVCESESRILVTFDRGFANIRAYPPSAHVGFIVFRLKTQEKPHVLAVAARVINALQEHRLERELWIVEENRIRIRS